MAVYGYLRISCAKEELNHFKPQILEYANNHALGQVQWYEEVISAYKTDWKDRGLKSLLDSCNNGDKIIVSEISRLARNTIQCAEIIQYAQSKGIELHIIKQNMVVKDNNDIATKIMLNIFSMCAELESDMISMRVKEALAVKKANGKELGRPKTDNAKCKLDEHKEEVIALHNNGSTNVFISKKYNVTPLTVSRWLAKHCK